MYGTFTLIECNLHYVGMIDSLVIGIILAINIHKKLHRFFFKHSVFWDLPQYAYYAFSNFNLTLCIQYP